MPCDKVNCNLKVECFKAYGKFAYPPCASEQGESPATTGNSDYTAALREDLMQFLEDESPVLFEDVDFSKLAARLNSVVKAQQNCA